MILLLETDKNVFRYGLVDKGVITEQGSWTGLAAMKRKVLALRKSRDIRLIGYRVAGGGSRFRRSAMERTASLVARLGETSRTTADNDRRIKELIDFCWERFVDTRHFILCDAAPYSSLPEAARSYAIPFERTAQGLQKHGQNGILHEWALRTYFGSAPARKGKVITILLGDSTNVVAFRNGQPVAVSNGYSVTDGIMSRTGCGWIDTSIVFRMFASGKSASHIQKVLSEESGFKAFLGGSFGLSAILSRRDAKACLARDIFSYQLLKCLGAYAAVLDGLDAVVIIGEDSPQVRDWAQGFVRELTFLGLRTRPRGVGAKAPLLTVAGSAVSAYYFVCDRWQAMAELVAVKAR